MKIRYVLSNKAGDQNKVKYIVFNTMLNISTNKIASWYVGLGCMMLPKVFPCLEILMVCTQNYDEDRKAIVNKNTQEEILSISEGEFAHLLNLGFEAQNSNIHIDLGKLAKEYERIKANTKDSFIKGLTVCGARLDRNHKPPYDHNIFVLWV